MKKVLLVLIFLHLACTSTSPKNTDASAPGENKDPFAYCESVVDVDHPTAPYTGPKLPHEIIVGLKHISVLPLHMELPSADYCQWRCMEKQVLACCVGANIDCTVKADTNTTATPAMNEFCSKKPNAAAIPAVATGRSTVYSWRCSGKAAVVNKQELPIDARGYATNFWHVVPVLQGDIAR